MHCSPRFPPRGSSGLRLFQTIPSALAALRANKGRSVLTTLGIIIGVAAVIAIVALGEGASASVSNQLPGLGTNLLTITPGSTRSGGARGRRRQRASPSRPPTPTPSPASIPGLSGVSPVVSGSAQIIAGSQNWSTRVQAVDARLPDHQGLDDRPGRAFTDQDNTNASNVAVLGQTVATNLFPNGQSPVGQLIRIRNVPFTVVGVLAEQGRQRLGGDQDDTVMIPFRTGQVRLFGADNRSIRSSSRSPTRSQIDTVTAEIDDAAAPAAPAGRHAGRRLQHPQQRRHHLARLERQSTR